MDFERALPLEIIPDLKSPSHGMLVHWHHGLKPLSQQFALRWVAILEAILKEFWPLRLHRDSIIDEIVFKHLQSGTDIH